MRKINLLISTCLISTFLVSQNEFKTVNGVKILSYSHVTNLPLMVSVNDAKNLSLSKFPQWLKTEFVKNESVSFETIKTEKDHLGMEHARFQQSYKGVRIENTLIIAHSDHNQVVSFNGDWFAAISPLNSKTISEPQALQYALAKINAKKYKWDNKAEEDHMRSVLNDPAFTYRPKAELVIFPVTDAKKKITTFLYAYKFNIYAEQPLYRANIYVDASSGKILKEQNLICTIDVPATASTKYSGTQPITTDNYSAGNYRLRETGRGNGIETYNLSNSTNYTNTDFTNNSTTWSASYPDRVATDAHWGAEKTYDYYYTTFNRNSIDDNGLKLLSYVHYDMDYVNAFWDGQRMTYGDGDVTQGYKEFTGLDVCGHEITHGLVQYTAQLSGGESDALNEAFADIFGTAIEWYARPSQHNWLIGDEITVSGTPLRNMSNPSALGQPDTYLGTNWDPNDEPHNNNGPCIYWYYLLSMGGSGTNDNGQAYTVSGISMAKASAIAYRALSVYMTPLTDYTNLRACAIQAAKDLYGGCSNEAIQTTNAWYAVGVGTQYVPGTINPDFIADETVSCTVPATISFTNQTNFGQTYQWYFGDGATSNAVSPVHTYTANGIYSVKLVATGCTAGSKDSTLKTGYINVNTSNPCVYSMPAGSTTYSVCAGTLFDDGGQNANYDDNTSRQITIVGNPGDIIKLTFVSFDMEAGYDYLRVYKGYSTSGNLIGSYTGSNLPGNGQAISTGTNVITIAQITDQFVNEAGYEMHWSCTSVASVGIETSKDQQESIIYPNPTNSNITISNLKGVNVIEIVNALGQIQQSVNVKDQSSVEMPLQSLANGLYFVKLYSDNYSVTKKVIKQ